MIIHLCIQKKSYSNYFPEYADFLEAFRERMIAVASGFVLGEESGKVNGLDQVRNRVMSMPVRW